MNKIFIWTKFEWLLFNGIKDIFNPSCYIYLVMLLISVDDDLFNSLTESV